MFFPADLDRLNGVDDLFGLDGQDFEYFCLHLLPRAWGVTAGLTPRGILGGDGGVDVLLYRTKGRPVACVQCKRWSGRPSEGLDRYLRDLAGAMQLRGIRHGVFMATVRATPHERALGRRLRIVVVDRDDLDRLIRTTCHRPTKGIHRRRLGERPVRSGGKP